MTQNGVYTPKVTASKPRVADACHCAALRKATRHVTRAYDKAFKSLGLRANQYGILAELRRQGGRLGLQELANILILERSALARNVRILQRRGWLSMTTSVEDRRERLVELTKSGRSLMSKAKPAWNSAQKSVANAIGARNSRRLRELLAQVTKVEL